MHMLREEMLIVGDKGLTSFCGGYIDRVRLSYDASSTTNFTDIRFVDHFFSDDILDKICL